MRKMVSIFLALSVLAAPVGVMESHAAPVIFDRKNSNSQENLVLRYGSIWKCKGDKFVPVDVKPSKSTVKEFKKKQRIHKALIVGKTIGKTVGTALAAGAAGALIYKFLTRPKVCHINGKEKYQKYKEKAEFWAEKEKFFACEANKQEEKAREINEKPICSYSIDMSYFKSIMEGKEMENYVSGNMLIERKGKERENYVSGNMLIKRKCEPGYHEGRAQIYRNLENDARSKLNKYEKAACKAVACDVAGNSDVTEDNDAAGNSYATGDIEPIK